MLTNRLFMLSLLILLYVSTSFADRDFFGELLKMPDNEWSSFIRSLKPEQVWKMANEAYEKGWDDYAVGVLILSKAFGDNWERHRPSCDELIAIVKDPGFHPGLRGGTAAAGMELSSTWNDDDFLGFVDAVLDFFQSEDIPYRYKWKIPDYLKRAMKKRFDRILRGEKSSPERMALIDQLHARSSVLMESLAGLVKNTPKSDSSLGEIVIGASICSGFYLTETFPPSPNRDRNLRNARHIREILVSILHDSSYPCSVRRLILRDGETTKLREVLSSNTVSRLKSDECFSDANSAAVLNELEQKTKTNPSNTL